AAWVVLRSVLGGASHPGLVLINPASGTAQVSLHLLGAPGDQLPPDLAMIVAPNSATLVPSNFLLALPRAAVVVRATIGEVVALGASTSLGRRGTDGYALALGVPIPAPG